MSKEEVLNKLNTPIITLAISVLLNMIEEKGKIYDDNYIISIISIIIPSATNIVIEPLTLTVDNVNVTFRNECFEL